MFLVSHRMLAIEGRGRRGSVDFVHLSPFTVAEYHVSSHGLLLDICGVILCQL